MELIKRKKKEMHKDVASKHQEYVTGLLCHITTNYYVTSQQTIMSHHNKPHLLHVSSYIATVIEY